MLLSDAPTALSLVGIAMTVPTIAFLLVGGVVSDRWDRRRVLIASDVVRGVAVGAMALLSLTGALELWHMIGLVAVYGVGAAFFGPAFDAVPDVLPAGELAQANSLDQFVRPIAHRLAGAAIGGVLIEVAGVGTASRSTPSPSWPPGWPCWPWPRARAGARRRRAACGATSASGSPTCAATWLWGTFGAAAVAYLLFMGPAEVLLPFVVKNQLGGSAADLGLVFAAGGVGSVGCAVVMGQRGLPRRDITFMYVAWTLATFAVAGYGVASAVWQLMLASLAFNALETAGTIVWATAKQRHVPAALLGRVSSLDWLISIGLLPLSFALTGPVSGAIGVQATLIGAAAIGGAVTFAALFLPGMREVEGAGAAQGQPGGVNAVGKNAEWQPSHALATAPRATPSSSRAAS